MYCCRNMESNEWGIGLNTAVSWLFIIAGVLFSFLNAITSYEMFQSVIESITDSAFGGLISQWFMLALISFALHMWHVDLFFVFPLCRFN